MKHVGNVGDTNTHKITAGKPEEKEKKLRDYGVNVTILLKLYPAQREWQDTNSSEYSPAVRTCGHCNKLLSSIYCA
jgi:hypothetical protein